MTVSELLNKYCFVESMLGEICFSSNCVTLEIRIQPGVFIAPDAPNPKTLIVSFEYCLFFEMERSNVADYGKDQLFLTHEGARTITAAVEDRSIIPAPWQTKYGSSINSLVIETVDVVLKIVCFSISVR